MQGYLFQTPVSNFAQEKMSEAQARVQALTDEQLRAPSLAETLEHIAEFKFEVAALQPEGRKGKRRTTKVLRNDYGRQVMADVDMIDVTIPFSGSPKSFQLSPSSGHVIDTSATVTKDGLLVSFRDDQNLDRNVDAFIERVAENLVSLKRDLEKFRPQILQLVQRIANERITQINARKERDKSRSFPIE